MLLIFIECCKMITKYLEKGMTDVIKKESRL